MPSIEESIETAVLSRAGGLVALTGLPLAWPNLAFQPPVNGRYLRVSHLPNVTDRRSRITHRRPGILQVTVVVPLDAGASAATRIAGQVVSHFPVDLPMDASGLRVRVYKSPDTAPALKSDPSWEVPVSISYETFK